MVWTISDRDAHKTPQEKGPITGSWKWECGTQERGRGRWCPHHVSINIWLREEEKISQKKNRVKTELNRLWDSSIAGMGNR